MTSCKSRCVMVSASKRRFGEQNCSLDKEPAWVETSSTPTAVSVVPVDDNNDNIATIVAIGVAVLACAVLAAGPFLPALKQIAQVMAHAVDALMPYLRSFAAGSSAAPRFFGVRFGAQVGADPRLFGAHVAAGFL